jgi:hypothetical protein
MRAEKLKLDDVKGAENYIVRSGDIPQQNVAVVTDGADPPKATDRVGFGGHAGDAHAAEHLGHGQDKDFLARHRSLRGGKPPGSLNRQR